MSANEPHVDDLDLVSRLDRELSPARSAAVDAHLTACDRCRTRADELRAAAMLARRALRSERDTDDHARARAALARAMALEVRPNSPGQHGRRILVPVAVVAVVTALAIVLVSGVRSRLIGRDGVSALPIASLTPGATASLTAAQLCSGEQPSRAVPAAIARRVLHAYAMEDASPDEYELDALITPELGGTVAAENLWPQRYDGGPWTAYVKDDIENHLRDLVCAGTLELGTAQQDMAANWIAAYQKYFHRDRPTSPQRSRDDVAELRIAALSWRELVRK